MRRTCIPPDIATAVEDRHTAAEAESGGGAVVLVVMRYL
jgi:hypothetical protein